MNSKEHITGIVLAGGKSSRMGTDKGFINIDGRSFISHVLLALKPLVSEIIIVSNNKDYDRFGHKRINDVILNSGPLAGLYSGLMQSKTTHNIVLSCDIPLITVKVLNKLIGSIDKSSEVILIESKGNTMPLVAVYKKQCAAHFYKQLQGDNLSIHKAIAGLKTKVLKLETSLEKYVININTPNDLKAVKDEYNH